MDLLSPGTERRAARRAAEMAEKKKAKSYEREIVERGIIKNTLMQKKREKYKTDGLTFAEL